jgi:hypothetical protein
MMLQERDRMFQALEKIEWLEPVPSDANFILCKVTDDRNPKAVHQALRCKGILVRFFGSQGGALERYIRFSAGKPEHTDRVIEALNSMDSLQDGLLRGSIAECAAAYQPEAILFDMDGVLADVGESYRRCIVEAAAALGVEVTGMDIRAAKAAGDANNDWVLTQRLVNAKLPKEKQVSFEQAKAEFEKLYQGTPEKPGGRYFNAISTLFYPISDHFNTVLRHFTPILTPFDAI